MLCKRMQISPDDMATFVDTEERETARLRQAEEEGLAQQTLTPVIKECLRFKILSDRHSHGLPEYQTLFAEPVKHELRDDEKAKLERRKQQNKEAARRCRQKKKLQKTAIETAYHEELLLKSGMDTEIRCIQRELESMQKFLMDHLKSGSCRIAHLSDSHGGYVPDMLPVSASSDVCHTSVDSQCQPQNPCPPETRHSQGRELSQKQAGEDGAITPSLNAHLSEHHGQNSELNQSHSWTVPDKQRLHETGPTVERFDEGRASNWCNCEVPQGHVSPSSHQVQQFSGSQAPGCGLMQSWLVPHADNSLEFGANSFHNSDTMADNTDSILVGRGSLGSEQNHSHAPRNGTLPPTLPYDDTEDVEVTAGHHSNNPEDIPRLDIQVFPEDLHNLILEEIHGTPEELHGLYTTARDKTQPNFLMV